MKAKRSYLKTLEASKRAERKAELSDEKNPAYLFQGTDKELLIKAIRGEINLNDMVKQELANRGLNINGVWVGFGIAAQLNPNSFWDKSLGRMITVPEKE